MNGSAPVDLGLDDDALSAEISLGGFPDDAIWSLYAATGAASVPLRFAGSYQRDDTGETVPVEVVLVAVRKKSTSVKPNRAKTPSRKSLSRVPISS